MDTGRLFPETYDLIALSEKRYCKKIEIYFPDSSAVEKMVAENGINLFFDSVKSRKECCKVRKIEPLFRALSLYDVWICGLRQEQSVTRNELQIAELDNLNKIKISPLYNWSEKTVWDYIKTNNVPYNTLHDKKFSSIGCACCTRALQDGEGVRDGRWWWEAPEHKECGLHIVNVSCKEKIK